MKVVSNYSRTENHLNCKITYNSAKVSKGKRLEKNANYPQKSYVYQIQ